MESIDEIKEDFLDQRSSDIIMQSTTYNKSH